MKMNTYVALLRGINVCGHNKLPMRELKELLTDLGLQDVVTYIQSGNVVFATEQADKAALVESIREAVNQSYGFAPQVLLLTAEEFA